ncbi:FeoA family protein [Halapricum hydrolyticum]|uniref:Ferrous iron transport protein A n=1 Tax=Halapricum hydrolyticum TaxID=2979991 RepID=A0AAE3IBX7_9EURY|nr:FeoA family protein [Halapricum hydrolyticum]MCU4718812.1 ferrous iron transport protein A [Halapricum hydrolyticum]MCU4727780.1 ferrous iron transport protein A [Halapricum hydrolyticum]
MTEVLADTAPGESVSLERVPDEDVRARLLRLGFLDGAVECRHRVRKGPIVLRRNGTEMALGADLAAEIEISHAEADR